jgi:hypothetical protein
MNCVSLWSVNGITVPSSPILQGCCKSQNEMKVPWELQGRPYLSPHGLCNMNISVFL